MKKMKLPWFKRIGILFIPKAFMGWTILAAGFAFAVCLFIGIDNKSHSVSDTLMNFVFNLFILVVVYSAIGFVSSWQYKKKT